MLRGRAFFNALAVFQIFLVLTLLFNSYPANAEELDISTYNVDPLAELRIPESCKEQYSAKQLLAGVVDFNNHSQGKVKVPPGWTWWQEAEVKLPEVAAEALINELVNMGGARIFTRSELKKVLEEQNLQASGLVDDKTLVGLGRIVGLQYIVTGSIGNIGFTTSAVSLMIGSAPQMEIQLTTRMIEVATGEIVVSKSVKGNYILDSNDYVGVIGAVKKAMDNAFEDIRPEFSKRFAVKSYIVETRTAPSGQKIALVDMGEKEGLKKGIKLHIYEYHERRNPITGKTSCSRTKLPVEGEVSGQLDDKQAWVFIGGDKEKTGRVCVGNIVERAPMEGQGFFKKMGLW